MGLPQELLVKPQITQTEVEKYYKKDPQKRTTASKRLSVIWEKAISEMKSLSTANIETHKGFHIDFKDSFHFVTKSKYKGGWNSVGMSDFGEYTLPHKVVYEGEFKDSTFDGEGILRYPMGVEVDGIWANDKLLSFQFRFEDGLTYEENDWLYCRYPDRRFCRTLEEGFKPPGEERLTNDEVPRKIPEGCYDVGEGFYNPKTKCIISAIDMKVIRIPSNAEEKWIMDNCRKAWDEPTGYRPDLYEYWSSGRESDLCDFPSEVKIERELVSPSDSDEIILKIEQL